MKQTEDGQLDHLLERWSRQQKSAVAKFDVEELRRAVVAGLESESESNGYTVLSPGDSLPEVRAKTRLAFAVLATAVCLLLAIGWSWGLGFFRTGSGLPESSRQNLANMVPEFCEPSEAELDAATRLSSEYHKLFGTRFAAAVEFESDVELLLNEDGAGQLTEAPPVFVRLSLASRGKGNKWVRKWSCDVIAHDQQLVHADAATEFGDVELQLWTLRLPDGQLLLDLDVLELPANLATGAYQNVMSMEGSSSREQRVLCGEEDGVEYCLFQSVSPLAEETT